MTCPTGKFIYLTWTHAQFDARALRRHKSNRSNREAPYSCRSCGHFHVGQSTKKARTIREVR